MPRSESDAVVVVGLWLSLLLLLLQLMLLMLMPMPMLMILCSHSGRIYPRGCGSCGHSGGCTHCNGSLRGGSRGGGPRGRGGSSCGGISGAGIIRSIFLQLTIGIVPILVPHIQVLFILPLLEKGRIIIDEAETIIQI